MLLLESLFNKVAGLEAEFCAMFQKTIFTEKLWMAASTDSFVPTKVLSTKHFFSFYSLSLLITPITKVCSERAV